MKIYDCFIFYNELDLLDLRLAELYDHVDYFVLVEANTTFQNKPKEFVYKNNAERYAKYQDKIIHVAVDDMPRSSNPWDNERFQRNAIVRGLDNAELDDIVIVGDVDELVRPEVIDHIRANPKDISAFRIPYFNFKFNYMLINNPETYSVWNVACRRGMLNNVDEFRNTRFQLNTLPWAYEDDSLRMYEHAGWHFTYLGDTEFIRNKIQSFSHSELNNSHVLDSIDVDSMIERGVGFNPLDPRPFVPVKLDEYFPKELVNNQDKYANYLVDADDTATTYLPKSN